MSKDDKAKKAKKEAMDRVERAANPAWKRAAKAAVIRVARARKLLTADDVMERINPAVSTHELRALGPVMRNAAKEGWIEKASVLPINCARRNCHGAPITVWKSLLFKGEAA